MPIAISAPATAVSSPVDCGAVFLFSRYGATAHMSSAMTNAMTTARTNARTNTRTNTRTNARTNARTAATGPMGRRSCEPAQEHQRQPDRAGYFGYTFAHTFHFDTPCVANNRPVAIASVLPNLPGI